MIKLIKVSAFFQVLSGDYHAVTELDPGSVPLISCGDLDNGLVGHFDIPAGNTYANTITVAYNGRPLTSKYHPYRFGAKDDVAVLLPKMQMDQATLLYAAAQINNLRWRYSYGRKCFKAKLENLKIPFLVKIDKRGEYAPDQTAIKKLFPHSLREYTPQPQEMSFQTPPRITWKQFGISKLFTLERGSFHSIAGLDPGSYATISRVTTNNGLVGYFDKPEGATVYPGGQITVSTVGGDAFVQMGEFIASDNVIICSPKEPMSKEVLFFIAAILNNQKWRYSYGRQPYKTKFQASFVSLPVDGHGKLDTEVMGNYATASPYWRQIQAESAV